MGSHACQPKDQSTPVGDVIVDLERAIVVNR